MENYKICEVTVQVGISPIQEDRIKRIAEVLTETSGINVSKEKQLEYVISMGLNNHIENVIALYEQKLGIKPYVDISKLPDNTFFYVENGGWNGFVTTENGVKTLYTAVNRYDKVKTLKDAKLAIEKYVRKMSINKYEACISNVKTIGGE